jgi:hypothetical protein
MMANSIENKILVLLVGLDSGWYMQVIKLYYLEAAKYIVAFQLGFMVILGNGMEHYGSNDKIWGQ